MPTNSSEVLQLHKIHAHSYCQTDRTSNSNWCRQKHTVVCFFFLIWFFTHFLNKIRYLLFVWRLVQIGAGLYLQDISFTMDVTFWRPKESRKPELVSVVNSANPGIPIIGISHGDLTFRQNFSSNTFSPLSSTQFWHPAATAHHYLLRNKITAVTGECLRDFQTS